jgi:hypothetical protein
MPVDDAPADDDVRQSYNFAPGYHGLVYRAHGPDPGPTVSSDQRDGEQGKHEDTASVPAAGHVDSTKYRLQAMKWGELAAVHSLVGRYADTARYRRSCSLLDQAQPGLRLHAEDYQLPRRLVVRRSWHVDKYEEEETVHCGRTGLL